MFETSTKSILELCQFEGDAIRLWNSNNPKKKSTIQSLIEMDVTTIELPNDWEIKPIDDVIVEIKNELNLRKKIWEVEQRHQKIEKNWMDMVVENIIHREEIIKLQNENKKLQEKLEKVSKSLEKYTTADMEQKAYCRKK